MMNLARTVALAVIALVLAADFALEYIWPRVVLSEHRSEYRELAVECALARASFGRANGAPDELDTGVKKELFRAVAIELISCHDQSKLKNTLLNQGINETQLRQIELGAMEEVDVPLRFMIEPYVGTEL